MHYLCTWCLVGMLPFAPALLTLALHIFFQHYLLHSTPFLHSALYYPHLHRRITLQSCTLAQISLAPLHKSILLPRTTLSNSVAQPSPASLNHPLQHPCTTFSCTLIPLPLAALHHPPLHLCIPLSWIISLPSFSVLHYPLLYSCTIIYCTLTSTFPAHLHHSLLHYCIILSWPPPSPAPFPHPFCTLAPFSHTRQHHPILNPLSTLCAFWAILGSTATLHLLHPFLQPNSVYKLSSDMLLKD